MAGQFFDTYVINIRPCYNGFGELSIVDIGKQNLRQLCRP